MRGVGGWHTKGSVASLTHPPAASKDGVSGLVKSLFRLLEAV